MICKGKKGYITKKQKTKKKRKTNFIRLGMKMVLTIELAKCPQLNSRPNVPNL